MTSQSFSCVVFWYISSTTHNLNLDKSNIKLFLTAVKVNLQHHARIFLYKIMAHFSRQVTTILSQTLSQWGRTCLFTQLTTVSPCASVFLFHLSTPKKCVCVRHAHQNGKVNPFELAVQLATEWINIHVRRNWYTPLFKQTGLSWEIQH